MTFMIYSLNGHERMPLEKVFKERMVENTEVIAVELPIEELEHQGTSEQHDWQHAAAQAYHTVEHLPTNPSVLLAEQVMTVPVVTLMPETRISDALRQFQANALPAAMYWVRSCSIIHWSCGHDHGRLDARASTAQRDDIFISITPRETAMKHQDSERTFRDPVCGMEVSRLSAVEAYDYQGKIYYFCSGHCREVFEAEPDKYLRHHRQHGVKRK